MTVLDELAAEARRRTEGSRKRMPLEELENRATAAGPVPSFEEALRREGVSFICEAKRASPSKGVIAQEYDPVSIAVDYERAGASCISVLTEPSRFLGDLEHLRAVASAVNIPVLRKDFVVDGYMVYEARCAGASAVLLICSILDDEELSDLIALCDGLSISALVEAHDASEVERALRCGARIIGVNNRDLRDFSVDPLSCLRLRDMVPDGVLFVAESGISSREDVEALERSGVNAVLIGETLMRAPDRAAKLRELGCRR